MSITIEEDNGVLFLKGGAGSGNHGHSGRAGVRGGSGGGGVGGGGGASFARVFHGTAAEYVNSIREKGLIANNGASFLPEGGGRPDSVYFTTDKSVAANYGDEKMDIVEGSNESAIVEFRVPDEYASKVILDEFDFEELGFEESFRIEQDVPPEWITKITLGDGTVVELNKMLKSKSITGYVVTFIKDKK